MDQQKYLPEERTEERPEERLEEFFLLLMFSLSLLLLLPPPPTYLRKKNNMKRPQRHWKDGSSEWYTYGIEENLPHYTRPQDTEGNCDKRKLKTGPELLSIDAYYPPT